MSLFLRTTRTFHVHIKKHLSPKGGGPFDVRFLWPTVYDRTIEEFLGFVQASLLWSQGLQRYIVVALSQSGVVSGHQLTLGSILLKAPGNLFQFLGAF